MPSLTLTCNKSAKIINTNPNANYSSDQYADGLKTGRLLMGFPSASSIERKKITNFSFSAFVIPLYDQHYDVVEPAWWGCSDIKSDWTEGSVTWNTRPTIDTSLYWTAWSDVAGGTTVTSRDDITEISFIRNVLQFGLAGEAEALSDRTDDSDAIKVGTRRAPSGRRPSITIEYENEDVKGVIWSMSPTSGNYPKTQATRFRWSAGPSGDCLASISVTNIKFRWRAHGEENYTEIDCGTASSYTVPANTFTTSQIDWQLVATDNLGNVTTTNWYTITTNDVLYNCQIDSPQNEIVDGSVRVPIVFRVFNTTGQTPQSLRFEYYNESLSQWWGWTKEGTIWNDWSTSGIERTFTISPGTLPSGEVQFRMYANNSEGTAGPYAYATFTYISAPAAPSVSVEAVPRAVISWQASGQLAYRVRIDETVYGPFFGGINSFTSPELLADGYHTAAVEVQGQYGLWSQPGTFDFTVTNVPPSETLGLAASFGLDAILSMTPSWNETPEFFVYRDGVKIATTSDTQYIDRLSLGEHSYQIKAVFASGNYLESGTVSGVTVCESMAVAPAAGGDWLWLRTSASSNRTETYTYSKEHNLRHFLGATYPILEESSFADLACSYEAGFANKTDADQFWRLRGKVVILKARGEVTVGLLGNVRKAVSNFLYTYSFELQRIHWEGLDDDANG